MRIRKLFGGAGLLLLLNVFFTNCTKGDTIANHSNNQEAFSEVRDGNMEMQTRQNHLTVDDSVRDVVNHPAFKEFGELLLPWEDNSRYYDTRLTQVGSLMPYHGNVNADVVVGALNRMINDSDAGKTVFYDFYTEQQKQADPAKKYTGLFFYRGKPGAPFAVVCPGGGFSYVGSLHEGFPIAEEISKKGFNTFVIRYRVNEQQATEDLAAALAYIFSNAKDLGVGTEDYSLWGGSAGARMVGNIAFHGVAAYGGGNLPKPAAAVIVYTGQSTYSSDFPPTFISVSDDDPIANASGVDARVRNLKTAGVKVDYHRYKRAGHGFGLGIGTDAEGWVGDAVEFWKSNLSKQL